MWSCGGGWLRLSVMLRKDGGWQAEAERMACGCQSWPSTLKSHDSVSCEAVVKVGSAACPSATMLAVCLLSCKCVRYALCSIG